MRTIKCYNCPNTFRLDKIGKGLIETAKDKGVKSIKCLYCGEFGFKI
jgi:hypothetical protein